jgi:hypothetical protein
MMAMKEMNSIALSIFVGALPISGSVQTVRPPTIRIGKANGTIRKGAKRPKK